MNFDTAFTTLIGLEGSYVNHPLDPGGETKFGISKRAYPGEAIPSITLARAKEIYLRDYWGPAGCDALPDAIKFTVFDMAVNAGVRTAVKTLQEAVGEKVDGSFGPKTLQAVQSFGPGRVSARFNGARLNAMTNLPQWSTFGNGWARRVAKNLMES